MYHFWQILEVIHLKISQKCMLAIISNCFLRSMLILMDISCSYLIFTPVVFRKWKIAFHTYFIILNWTRTSSILQWQQIKFNLLFGGWCLQINPVDTSGCCCLWRHPLEVYHIIGKIIAVAKKSSPEEPNDYRPISILSSLCLWKTTLSTNTSAYQ